MEWLKGVFCIAVIMKFSSFRVTIKFLKYQLTLKYHLLQADIANYPLGCHLYLYCWGLLTKWRPNGVKDATSAPPHWQTVQTNTCNWGPPSYVFYKPCDPIYKQGAEYFFGEIDKTNKIQRKVKNWRRREETLDTKTGKNNAQWKIWEGGKRYEAKNREDVTSGEQQLLFLLFNTCLQHYWKFFSWTCSLCAELSQKKLGRWIPAKLLITETIEVWDEGIFSCSHWLCFMQSGSE